MTPIEWQQIVLPLVMCAILVVLAAGVPRYRFALMGFVAMVGYAVLQDQISARLCPEYFTVLHPPIPGLSDPTLLGISWGFLGGWWGGVLLGYVIGLLATLGPNPKLAPRELVWPLLLLVGALAFVTAATGVSVWHHSEMLGVTLDAGMTDLVPAERHRGLLTVACYHLVAYVTATAGGVVICVWVAAERRRRGRPGEAECLTNSSD